MNSPFHLPRPEAAGEGQPQRFAGMSRDAALHEQLYRYAEDLEQMVERNTALEAHYGALRESCERLTESRVLLDDLINSSHDIHIVTDGAGTILQCNPAVAPIAAPQQLAGYNLQDWVLPSYQGNFQLMREAVLGGTGVVPENELRLRRMPPNESPLIVNAQVLAVSPEGEKKRLHWVMRDMTRMQEIQFESQVSTMVFKSAAEGVMITDIEGGILAINPAFSRITGYSAADVVGRNPRFLKSGLQDASFYKGFWEALTENGYWQGEVYNRKKNGEIYPEWLTVSSARDSDGKILSYIAVFSDLSRLLQTEKRLSYLAHHDTLTGLPNRLLFQDRLAQTLTQARRSGVPFTLIFIDLDRFKQINDTLGHEVGDQVLREVGQRLSSVVREADTVARLGGDEFVILAPALSGDDDIGSVCAKALETMAQPILVGDHELYVGGSFGCAEYPRHGDDETNLLKHADVAMYRAKAVGGNTHAMYEQHAKVDDGMLRLETEMRRALERNEMRLEFQPQVTAEGGELMGVEALLRWDHPRLGAVPPVEFIPVAEQIGQIIPIGAWVLDAACRQLAEWDARQISVPVMAVNVSPRQLRDPRFVDTVRSALTRHGIAPERLELEVTEGEVMFHIDTDHSKLMPLRSLGIKIAIDNFGTGYSSLARLKELPIDRIKIDRSFITALEEKDKAYALAISGAIVTMGRALGLGLIAEGVESLAQHEVLAGQGCEAIQGYLIGRPMRPEALAEWVATRTIIDGKRASC